MIESCVSGGEFLQKIVGPCRPENRLRIGIVPVDGIADGHDQLLQILEDSAPDSLVGQITEEPIK